MSKFRKDDHIRLAKEQTENRRPEDRTDFDHVEILHHALAGISPADIDLATPLGPWNLTAPLYINGMTGGTETAEVINRNLAIAAAATGIPMASGSVGLALDDPSTAKSFTVIREENPDGIVWANIGAGRPVDHAHRAVDLLEADALQIHLNAIQETVMPEGSRDFSSWMGLIEDIVAALEPDGVPVIVKEVGFGLSAVTLRQLSELGVQLVDASGAGGTNFATIENDRRLAEDQARGADPVAEAESWAYVTGMGSSAVRCLLDARVAGLLDEGHSTESLTETNPVPSLTVLASGGVRHPLDVVRALALGARAVGVAGTFLRVAMDHGPEVLTEVIRVWLRRISQLMVLTGAPTPADLSATDVLLTGAPAEFARLRGLDQAALASRHVLRPGTDAGRTPFSSRYTPDV